VLAGRRVAFYDRVLVRARAYVRRVARPLTPAAMARPRVRRSSAGGIHHYNARGVLYHLLEHLAGHYGQILLLRHQYRARRARAARRRRPPAEGSGR
jgi:hypothetical protein